MQTKKLLPMNLVAAPVKARLIFSRPTRLEIKPPLHSGGYEVHGEGEQPWPPNQVARN